MTGSTTTFTSPGFPEQRGAFANLAPSHFRVVTRRAQFFSAKEIAQNLGLAPRTVDEYLTRARKKLGYGYVNEMLQAYVQEYGPEMWPAQEVTV